MSADLNGLRVAMRAGARYRRLVVACPGPRQHAIATVYAAPGPDGAAVLWLVAEVSETGEALELLPGMTLEETERAERAGWPTEERVRHHSRARQLVLPLDDLAESVEVACRCRREQVGPQWLRAQLAAGRRRVLHPGRGPFPPWQTSPAQ